MTVHQATIIRALLRSVSCDRFLAEYAGCDPTDVRRMREGLGG